MSVISEKFNAKISALKNDFEVNREIFHQGVKGGLNESELSSLIKEVIPQKYKISKGIIENAKGVQSNETDFFVYDDEILPSYIKNDLAFVPVEAVKYVFEVKSTLNSTELKTTIEKFKKYADMGGNSPTVLFAFSSDLQGSELARYKKSDAKFHTYPSTMVLCIANKGYYYKDTTEHYLKDFLSAEDFLKKSFQSMNIDPNSIQKAFSDLLANDKALNEMSLSEIASLIESSIQFRNVLLPKDDRKITINNVVYSEIKFKVHQWKGIECSDNNIELSLLSGISNTLCKEKFGHYLLHKNSHDMKIFSVCCEDMWGNLSCMDFNENGFSYNPNEFSFELSLTKEENKIIFEAKK